MIIDLVKFSNKIDQGEEDKEEPAAPEAQAPSEDAPVFNNIFEIMARNPFVELTAWCSIMDVNKH